MNEQPKGTLTGPQLEIMEIVWSRGTEGLTAADIWQEMQARRPLARTTVLTLAQRLEKRGWLVREGEGRGALYRSACEEKEATARLAANFVDVFFGGSPSRLVMSLLGQHQVSPGEVQKLRALLEAAEKEENA
jgi:BlaI family penicillinase repressor